MPRPRPTLSTVPETRSLTDQAYASIRHDIIRCVLEPGAEFTEVDLAARLEMSKTPVREALARLQFEGLVRAFPRRGYQIAPIKVSDINDIFDLRVIVEAGAMELAVKRAKPAELDHLAMLARESSDATYNEDPGRSHEVNNSFHEGIARTSGNVRLHRSVLQLLQELERFFYLEAQSESAYPPSHVDHQQIVATMRDRDAANARKAIIEHIEGTRRVLLGTIAGGMTAASLLLA